MDSFKKPLSEKVMKKRMRRELEKARAMERKLQNDASHQSELEKPPPGLKGRALGLWHRDRARAKKEKEMKDNEIGKSAKKNKNSDKSAGNKAYRIDLYPDVEQKISRFLASIQNEPPPSLKAQFNFLKSNNYRSSLPPAVPDTVFDVDNISNSVPEALLLEDTAGCSKMADREEVEHKRVGGEDTVGDNREAIDYWVYGGASTSADDDVANGINQTPTKTGRKATQNTMARPRYILSLEKYRYLEDTPFKRKFLRSLTGCIESNLEQALCSVKLIRNATLDERLQQQMLDSKKKKSNRMFAARKKLPAYSMRTNILKLIEENQVILISGETGCGKTTQVAQFILEDAIEKGMGSTCSVICTQPRRISAISVATRVAQERGETVGSASVGYQIRLDKKVGRENSGSILFCTTGILLQFMQSDPALGKYSHIILDEIHERDTLSDFALTIIRDVIKKRKDLKVILMSATLNAEKFSQYFDNCPLINIPGYTYPVTEYYLEDVLQLTKFNFEEKKGSKSKKKKGPPDQDFLNFVIPYVNKLKCSKKYPTSVLNVLSNPESESMNPELVVALLTHICTTKGPGAVLIFVPGWEDISQINRLIISSGHFPERFYTIIPLHSMMPTVNQQSVFERPPPGVRKIIIATNIAETSITIDDVVYVIDCGKIKIKNFDVVNNVSTLKPEWVSKANATQRKGRAGRVQAGICYHLFSRGREAALADYTLPEMLRTKLEELVLYLKMLQLGRAAPFLSKVLDPPNPLALDLALDLLVKMNALDENEQLTPLGYHLAQLPMDPQIGKMLIMACFMSCLNPVLSIAAALTFRDPFYVPLDCEKLVNEQKLKLDYDHKSDHLIIAEVMEQWEENEKRGTGRHFCSENFLTRSTLFSLKDQKVQFSRYLFDMGFLETRDYKSNNLNRNSDNALLIKAVICSGLYPNVAVIKKEIKVAQGARSLTILSTAEDGKVMMHPKSVNSLQKDFENDFLVYHEKLKSSCVFLHDTTMVSPIPLILFGHNFGVSIEKKGRVIIHLKKDLLFSCTKEVSDLLTELHIRLDWLLEYQLSHPGEIRWDKKSTDTNLLRALVDLITYQDNSAGLYHRNSSSEDTD